MPNWIYASVRTEDEQLVAPSHISSYYGNRADFKNIGFSPSMKLQIVLQRNFVYEMGLGAIEDWDSLKFFIK